MPVGKNQLTPKQRRYAAEYHVLAVDPNCHDPVAEAARRAGFASKSAHSAGSRVLHMDKVQVELARLGAEVAQRHKIDQDFFVRELLENHRIDRAGAPVLSRNGDTIMRDGVPLVKSDIGGSNKALELLARITGEMVEKRDVTNRNRSLEDMDEAELEAERIRLQTEVAKLIQGGDKVVELHAVEGGKDGDAA